MRLPDTTWAPTMPAGHLGAVAGARAAGQPGGFSRLFREVNEDVRRFIVEGAAAASTGITPEGAWQRLRLQQAGAVEQGSTVAPATGVADRAEQAEFLAGIEDWASEAAERLGVSTQLVAAHAALESGWGKRPLRGPDGASTNNLFGIKASGRWQGAAVQALTTEHEDGEMHKRSERFRSYPDMGSAFRDYAQLLLDNPRYRAALNTGNDAVAFAQGLARGGYATDPDYAYKLVQVVRQIQSRE